MLDKRICVKELFGMVERSPEYAQNYVSTLVEEILTKKLDTLRSNFDSRLNYNSCGRNELP